MGLFPSPAAVLGTIIVATLGGQPPPCDPAGGEGSCVARDAAWAGDDAFSIAQLRAIARRSDRAPAAPQAADRALGILQLDGYYWPTQPGDLSDLRTFCSVWGPDGDDYRCNSVASAGGDEFSLAWATIVNGSWPLIQHGQWTGLEHSFTQAVEHFLLAPEVHALMGGAGWFTWYQTQVQDTMRDVVAKKKAQGVDVKMKPWLGGTPAMLPALGSIITAMAGFLPEESAVENAPNDTVRNAKPFVPILDWDLLKNESDRLLFMTSNTVLANKTKLIAFLRSAGVPVGPNSTWGEVRVAVEEWLGVDIPEYDDHTIGLCAFLHKTSGLLPLETMGAGATAQWAKVLAQKVIIVPWAKALGYGLAVTMPGSLFHNVPGLIRGSSSVASVLLGTILQHTKAGENIVGIFMESSEMPAYSNWVRNITSLPVWDSTVVARCLMVAAPSYDAEKALDQGNGPVLFNTPAFHQCMMEWWDAGKWDTRAGLQKDGFIKYYDSLNLTSYQQGRLTCTGGRVDLHKIIGRRMDQFVTGKFGPDKIHASCLTATPCGGRTWQGMSARTTAEYGALCEGTCPAGYYCGGDVPFQVPGLEGVPGGIGHVYGLRGQAYPTLQVIR